MDLYVIMSHPSLHVARRRRRRYKSTVSHSHKSLLPIPSSGSRPNTTPSSCKLEDCIVIYWDKENCVVFKPHYTIYIGFNATILYGRASLTDTIHVLSSFEEGL
jgi:hypothetical protein